jgi:hypothetical protein
MSEEVYENEMYFIKVHCFEIIKIISLHYRFFMLELQSNLRRIQWHRTDLFCWIINDMCHLIFCIKNCEILTDMQLK